MRSSLWWRRRSSSCRRRQGHPSIRTPASGLVAGEGLAGVMIAFLAFEQRIPKEAVMLALCWFLYAAGRKGRESERG